MHVEIVFGFGALMLQSAPCEHECELVSKNGYFWNILMTGTKYFKNILVPRRNDVENIFPHLHG
jgi:hypothetical protein